MDMLGRVLGRQGQSKNVAKERLRLVLVQDRSFTSPQMLESLKNDLISTISRYMDIENDRLDVSFASDDKQVALVANIPVKNLKRAWQN